MRFGGFQFALLALALSACADSDKPIAGFDTITVDIPPQATQTPQTAQTPRTTPTKSQAANVEPAVAPAPARKPAETAVAKARSQPKREARLAPKRKEPVHKELVDNSTTLTPEDAVLRPQPPSQPQPQPQAAKPAASAMVQEDAQGRTTITPRALNIPQGQGSICKDAPQAVCKGIAECGWVDTYTIGPGVYVDGYCESR